MGQCSRISRATRFIDEFNDDVVARSGFKPGDKLVVKSVALGMLECQGEEVVVFVRLAGENGGECEMTDNGLLFDPEYMDDSDMVERVVDTLEIPEADATARLRRAKLMSGQHPSDPD